jgi:DNA-binding CsgD family transcriptional regulator
MLAPRRGGVSFRQIGRRLGISESTAFGVDKRVMGRLNDVSIHDAQEIKALQLAQHEDQ